MASGAILCCLKEEAAQPGSKYLDKLFIKNMVCSRLIIVFGYLIEITIFSAISSDKADNTEIMSVFMGGLFLVFSFFKMLDMKGFAYSYITYDIIAKKWEPWGYIYSFTELVLGVFLHISLSTPGNSLCNSGCNVCKQYRCNSESGSIKEDSVRMPWNSFQSANVQHHIYRRSFNGNYGSSNARNIK